MKTIRVTPKDQGALEEVRRQARALLDRGSNVVVTVAEEGEALSPSEAAERLGFSRQHVMRLVEAGKLDAERMPSSKYWKIRLDAILAFEERRNAARERAAEFSRDLDRLGAPAE